MLRQQISFLGVDPLGVRAVQIGLLHRPKGHSLANQKRHHLHLDVHKTGYLVDGLRDVLDIIPGLRRSDMLIDHHLVIV